VKYPSSAEFTKHSENVAEIAKGLTQVERAHKAAIRSGQSAAVLAQRRVHQLLIGVLAEAMLRKIVTDPTGGFGSAERSAIWTQNQPERWKLTVELAFRRHYQVQVQHELSAQTLGAENYSRYQIVINLLSNELHPVITDRNRTAHGQWKWQLKSRSDNDFKKEPAPVPPDYTISRSQSELISLICRLVYILVVSEPTFDREYDTLTERIERRRKAIDGSEYEAFVAELRPSVRP
jgi:hypothetical protein